MVMKKNLFAVLSEVARFRLSQSLLVNNMVIERELPGKGKAGN